MTLQLTSLAPNMDIDKDRIPPFQAKFYTKFCILSFCHNARSQMQTWAKMLSSNSVEIICGFSFLNRNMRLLSFETEFPKHGSLRTNQTCLYIHVGRHKEIGKKKNLGGTNCFVVSSRTFFQMLLWPWELWKNVEFWYQNSTFEHSPCAILKADFTIAQFSLACWRIPNFNCRSLTESM
jgi:hypothetical protein